MSVSSVGFTYNSGRSQSFQASAKNSSPPFGDFLAGTAPPMEKPEVKPAVVDSWEESFSYPCFPVLGLPSYFNEPIDGYMNSPEGHTSVALKYSRYDNGEVKSMVDMPAPSDMNPVEEYHRLLEQARDQVLRKHGLSSDDLKGGSSDPNFPAKMEAALAEMENGVAQIMLSNPRARELMTELGIDIPDEIMAAYENGTLWSESAAAETAAGLVDTAMEMSLKQMAESGRLKIMENKPLLYKM